MEPTLNETREWHHCREIIYATAGGESPRRQGVQRFRWLLNPVAGTQLDGGSTPPTSIGGFMNTQNISDACMLVFDTLRNDKDSVEIIELIDEAEGDTQIKDGLKKAAARLDIVNPAVAKTVREKAKGFAF